MATKNKKKRNRRIIAVIVILIIAVLLYVRFTNVKNQLIAGYEAVEVTVQDMQATVRGSGTVESGETLKVYAPANITIDEVYVENGDNVSLGDPIAKINSDDYLDAEKSIEDSIDEIDSAINSLYSSKGSTSVYSAVSGTVKNVYVSQSDYIEAVINENGSLMVISADNNMRLELSLESVENYSIGQEVFINVDDEQADGVITDINEYESMLKIIFEDNKYMPGQSVSVFDLEGNEIGTGGMMINVPVYVSGDAGIAGYVYVKENTAVSKGTKLLSVKENDASAQLIELTEQKAELQGQMDEMRQALTDIGMGKDYIIYAPAQGIVDNFILQPYTLCPEGTEIMSIQTTDTMEIVIPVDELDISKIEIGQIAELKFEALDGEKYQGTVAKINSLGQAVNGVTNYNILITIKEPGNILIGMSGTAKIITESKENVVTVPVEAVQIINDEYYVILGEDANVKTVADHKITTGINDGAYIEVLDGLSEGDTIAVLLEEGIEIQVGRR